jgi:hypothetical protein
MVKLRLLRGIGPPPKPAAREVVLRDQHGRVQAFGWIADRQYWIDFPGLATFRFRPGADEVVAATAASVDLDLVVDTYHGSIMPLVLQALGLEALHASAVRVRSGVVGFCALSETGKSTIAYGLGLRGHPLWADDALAFETPPGRPVTCLPLPFTLQLRQPSQAYFHSLGPPTPEARLGPNAVRNRTRLAALFVLERIDAGAGRAAEIVRLSGAEALRAVLPHAYAFSPSDADRKRRTIHSYLDLLARVPIFRLRFEPALEKLPRLLDDVERAVGMAGAR